MCATDVAKVLEPATDDSNTGDEELEEVVFGTPSPHSLRVRLSI